MYTSAVPPIECSGDKDCFSYLISGGLELVTPWTPLNWSSYPFVRIKAAPSIHLEFTKLIDETFSDADCEALGDPHGSIGIRLCVAADDQNLGVLRAGMMHSYQRI
jgi:hypothetical protein